MKKSSTVEDSSNYDAGIAAYKRGHYEMAMYDFERRAIDGDPKAQFCLAFIYKYGLGVIPNSEKAIAWYTKSAEQGYAPAQNDLGVTFARLSQKMMVRNSAVESKKYAIKAFEWFQKAAEQYYPAAQYNIALVSFIEAEVIQHVDPKGAEELFQDAITGLIMSAEHNYPPAQNELAQTYLFGLHGITKNIDKALELYTKAAIPKGEGIFKNGYSPAQHSLGTIYAEGIEVEQNYEKALNWYRKAAAQRYTASQYSLGVMYYKGNGVNRDLKESANWYQRAAEQGHMRSQLNLGRMCRLGEGVSQNSEKAARLTLEAAQQGAAIAQTYLGEAFEKEPNDQLQDNEEAYYWYSLAIKNKDDLDAAMNANLAVKVSERLERVSKLLTKEQRDRIDARVNNWKPRVLYASGTGFYINEKHLLTNAHVLRWKDVNGNLHEFDEVRIGLRYVEEKPESLDLGVDLALLYDAHGNQDTATFRSCPIDLGEEIVVYGFPLSHILSYIGNITSGIVSGLMSAVSDPHPENRFQHTAPIQKGNSGGPVFDAAGNVVGVIVSSLNPNVIQHQNVNFAIKFDAIEDFLQSNNITDYKEPIPFVRKGVDRKDIFENSGKFTTAVLCYINKVPDPMPLEEIGIDGIVQE